MTFTEVSTRNYTSAQGVSVYTAECPNGDTAISGGYDFTSSADVLGDYPAGGSWIVAITGQGNKNGEVWAVCASPV
jgi:hypothetical protein